MSKTQQNSTTRQRFFLPDFCHAQSVFMIVLVAELLALLLSLARFQSDQFWLILGRYSLFIQWITLISAALLCALRSRLRRFSDGQAGAISYLLILLVTFTAALLAQWLEQFTSAPVSRWQFDWGAVAYSLLLAAILSAFWLRLFYLQTQHRLQIEAQVESRLQALQARIKPHFLFNSMNILSSLVRIDPDLAEQLIEDLSELFRMSLSEHRHLIPLEKEITITKKYLQIEQLRLGDRLQVEWTSTVNENDYQIPPLVLQPLVENAVYHGIQPLVDGGRIRISFESHEDRLVIVINNPCPEITNKDSSGNQLALENVRNRLGLLFGDQLSFQYQQVDNQYQVILKIPKAT